MKSKETFRATVNEKFIFEAADGQLDAVQFREGQFHILKEGKSLLAEVIAIDFVAKIFTIKVNGTVYNISLEDKHDQLVKRLGLTIAAQHMITDIKAPMPGLVLSVAVEAGQEVKKGDTLLILEAMKMENVIKSPGDGTVKKVHVKKGEPVEKSLLLIEME